MKKYKYLHLSHIFLQESELNTFGKQGWKLISLLKDNIKDIYEYIFIKELID